jgi:hypothetical protein
MGCTGAGLAGIFKLFVAEADLAANDAGLE